MSIRMQSLPEVSRRAEGALIKELGIVDAMRFLNQFRPGSGDYTAEREAVYEKETVASVLAGIKAARRPAESA
jgi:hypothetical protein